MKYIKNYLYPLIISALSVASFFMAIGLLHKTDVYIIFVFVSLMLAVASFAYVVILLVEEDIKKSFVLKKFAAYILTILLALLTIQLIIKYGRGPASKQVCGTNLSGLGKTIFVYANDYDGYYPDCNQWCDLLILFADVPPRIFICDQSDTIIGESSYAMNINLNGKKLSQIDPNTVVLFGTIYGKDTRRRNVTVSTRHSYKVLKERGEDVSFFGKKPDKRKVYKNRWNQAGGPELLTAKKHKGFGANILFTDGSARWIEKEDFNNLNWGQDKKEQAQEN